jgi:hypothetical protein
MNSTNRHDQELQVNLISEAPLKVMINSGILKKI